MVNEKRPGDFDLEFNIRVQIEGHGDEGSYERRYKGRTFVNEKSKEGYRNVSDEVYSALTSIGLPRPMHVMARVVVEMGENLPEGDGPRSQFVSAARALVEHWRKHDELVTISNVTAEELIESVNQIES